MAIRYVAYTSSGERVSGVLAVDTEAQAEEQLWRADLIVASLRRQQAAFQVDLTPLYRQLPTFFRPKAQELVTFSRELATLLSSGIALHPTLKILRERVTNPLLRQALQQIIWDIEAGSSLSQAIAKYPTVFPTIYSRLLTVGEETGKLELALRQIADYLERQAELAQKVRGAVSYPFFVIIIAIASAFFLVSFALPPLITLFKEYATELPLPTRILVAITDLGRGYGLFIVLGVAGLLAALLGYTRTARGARWWGYQVLRIPLVGRVVRTSVMAGFVRAMHTLLTAGLPITEALELSAKTTTNTPLKETIARVNQELMVGQSFSQALIHQPLFPNLVPQMVSVGEQAGTLTQNLETLANFLDRETTRRVSQLTGMLGPALVLAVGGVVGFIAVAVMSSLYGIMQGIK